MATATPTKPTPAAAREAAVERAIATAAGKVRANDLLTGAAAVAVLLLGYLAVVVTLDRLLDLPGWVRLLGLLGLVGGLAAVVYLLIIRPMQRRVNPRYVARKMEETLPDAKNVLINWVDLQDEQLPGSVKAAVGAKAAAGVADADVDSATNSRLLVWLGSAAGVLVLVLAVLFLVFSGPQFMSLLQRAVVPFKSPEIASATVITVTQPDGGDVTISDLESLTVAVTIDGRQPDPNGPDKPRLLLRYSPDAPVAKEVPLARGDSSDRFTVDLSRSDILNGVYYQVAAGDARTPEYRVTVRTRPMLSRFEATYEYPAYLKWPNDTEAGTRLKALRGTTVTLTAKANRAVKSTTLTAFTVDGAREIVRGEVFGEAKDQVRFKLKLRESGTYRIEFRPTDADHSATSADYPIEVEVDAKPVVSITKPVEDEITLPLNGLLAVDGKVRDDHGIARIELRFQVEGNEALAIRPKAYMNGDPLKREKDDSLITDLTGEGGPDAPVYKDSVRLDQLTDADGKPVKLKEGDTLVYWLAAIDNCTEPKANEGESTPRKRVKLVAAPKEPEKKQEQANKEQQRKDEEKKGEQKLDEQRKNETRPETENRNPEKDPQQPKQPEGQPGEKDPMKADGDPTKGDTPPQGKPDGKQDGKQENGKGGDMPPPNDPEQQKKQDDLKRKIEEQKRKEQEQAGDARGDGDPSQGKETKPDANTKPPEGKPGDAGSKGAAEGKEGPKPEDMTKPEGQPSEGKDAGTLTDPKRSEDKPAPKPDAKGNDKPTGDQPKDAPKEGTDAGTTKESKADPSPKPNDPKQPPQDPMNGDKKDPKKDGSAGSARGAEPPQEKEGQPQDPMNGGTDQPKPGQEKKVDPKDLSGSKPKGEPTRGDTKPEPKQGEGQKGEEKKDAGGAKGETPNKPAESKDPQKGADGQPMQKKGPPQDAGTEKQPPQQGGDGKDDPAQSKGEGKQPEQPMPGGKGEDEKGKAKPSDIKKGEGGKAEDKKDPTGNGSGEKQPDPKDHSKGGGAGDQKLDKKEMEQAIKDLDSKDPKTKQAAREKLDKAVGKENREQIEQAQKDLKSDDKAKQDAAKQKLEDMAKKGQGQPGDKTDAPKPKELTEEQKKELTEAAKNLDSKDEKTKKDAQDKLDKAIGKENREQVEQMQKDLKSDNKETREQAEKKLQEMAKQAQQGKDDTAKKPEMTEEQKKELADAAGKLNSKDEAERKAAEQKIDDAIGKKNREELQQDLKDAQGNDPAKAEQAKKKLEKKIEEAKNAQNGKSDKHNDTQIGGGNNTTPGKPLDANLENQLKSRELALDDFKKYRGNKEFLKENNFTDAEYERFLRQEEAAVQKLREKVDQARVNPTPEAGGPATVGRNEFSGGGVTGRGSADKVDGSGTKGVPPPGFGPAVQRFNQEASKQPQK